MKNQLLQKPENHEDFKNSSFTRQKFQKNKLKNLDYPKLLLPSQDKSSFLHLKPSYIPVSITQNDLISPISSNYNQTKSKRSASVKKSPNFTAEKILDQELTTINNLKQSILKVVDNRVSKMKKSINDQMNFMNKRGILNPSANQLRADSQIEAESYSLYFPYRNKSINHIERAEKLKFTRKSIEMPKKDLKNRISTLQKVKSVILNINSDLPSLIQYPNISEFCKSTIRTIEQSRSSITLSLI